MAQKKEQTFRSPGFFDREIDLSQRQQAPLGVPAGVIGTAEKGPAFVPVTVGSFPDFTTKFGNLDPSRFGPYAVNEFMKHRTALTYMRVLGGGANDTSTHIETTRTQGTVRNAGFVVDGQTAVPAGLGARETGGVVFIAAKHEDRSGEAFGYPILTDNSSFGTGDVSLIRAMIMMASGTRMLIHNGDEVVTSSGFENADDEATLDSSGKFKLIISSSATGFATMDNLPGVKVLTASLNPANVDYIGKILNTDPAQFPTEEHLLYGDFAFEDEIASVSDRNGSVLLLSGTGATSTTSGDTTETFSDVYGRFDTRFTTPKTTTFFSQPFGSKEFDLFYFEALDDGAYANTKIKVSIANIRKSTDPAYEYGTFAVQVRAFGDHDRSPEIIETFPECNLDPSSENYVAAKIGDMKVAYSFDADQDDERRLQVSGRFPNKSQNVRIIMNQTVEDKLVPALALPFGFHGPEVLNTSDRLGDAGSTIVTDVWPKRLTGFTTGSTAFNQSELTGSVIPPLPLTFKVTRGPVSQTPNYVGMPGANEIVDSRFYWGVKTTRCPQTGSQAGAITNAVLNANNSTITNPLVETMTKFHGIGKLDAVVTGSSADDFCDNKFTLARVALRNNTTAQVTGTADLHMKESAYIRNGTPDPNGYKITDILSGTARVTLASLVNLTSSAEFNKFSNYNKFTNLLYGGFDGVNILDVNATRMNDKASSSDTGGAANASYTSPGLNSNVNGTGKANQTVYSYRTAARIMTDDMTVNTNLLAIPGIRDSFITNYARDRSKEYGLAMFVEDVVEYDEDTNRLFDDSTAKPNVRKTAEQLETRAIDNNYGAIYFPDVVIDDDQNNRRIQVPASVAAMGALAFNDRAGFPWFAPAGFNRGALDFVSNTDVRLNKPDRDVLQGAKINPIAHFPVQGTTPAFVIFGQKTLQAAASALDRVNVRRMLLEVKRIIANITREGFVFEQNTPATRERWVKQVTEPLALVQLRQGIEAFRVVMDETNNTQDDVESNRLNGRIVLVPTRTIEHISMDFIITNAGVSFVE